MKEPSISRFTLEQLGSLPNGSDSEDMDRLTDEETEVAALADPDAQPLTGEQLRQFRRVHYARGEKVWEDDKTIGEWMDEQGEVPTLIDVDSDIAAWFRARGGNVRNAMNSVLREYVQAHQTG